MTTPKKAKATESTPRVRPWAEHPQPVTGGEYVRDGEEFEPTADEAKRRQAKPAPAPPAPEE